MGGTNPFGQLIAWANGDPPPPERYRTNPGVVRLSATPARLVISFARGRSSSKNAVRNSDALVDSL